MKNSWGYALVAMISTVATLLLSQLFGLGIHNPAYSDGSALLVSQTAEARALNQSPQINSFADLPDFRGVARRAVRSVVNIIVLNEQGYRTSGGSGVIISRDGYIITNHHVVDEGEGFRVQLADKRRFPATVIGLDPSTDLALIKIEAENLEPALIGDSDAVEVGEWVLAVGNPFNLFSTVTAGIVSAKGRSINILDGAYAVESFIQTDAVVNPGNSGGALINARGELIGINTAIISKKGNFEGYSFAVPSNLMAKVVEDLRDYRRVRRAVLGVGIRDLNVDMARRLGLESATGVLITNINRYSSADKAGLSKGDVIVSVNNVPTNSVPELQEQVAIHRPGDIVSIDFVRNGRRMRRENVELQELIVDGGQ